MFAHLPSPASSCPADPTRASQQFLSLSQTTVAQLVGVVVPSIALYRMEARARRAFVQRRWEIA